ncbi:hypothetical protein [Conexibacter woesei]|uniref:hypothetical protein n=1 Tax=Conexibacter woesei TaxID=191495 RepID=UPI000420F6C3|nr:hypothetical protein [Conexibacter woesei]
MSPRPALVALDLHADPARWEMAGFRAGTDRLRIGTTDLVFLPGAASGLVGWTLAGAIPEGDGALAGVPTTAGTAASEAAAAHPNTVSAIDHIVLTTPDTARTFETLEAAGFELRRVRDAGSELRQGFFLFSDLILEVVGPPEPAPGTAEDPARLWGITLVADDLDAAARATGASEPRDAVQPGRRIAIVPKDAGLGTRVALMSPRS